jgi:hypothetical protein
VFLPWTYVFFLVQLVGFWVLFTVHDRDEATARVFFVWVSVFNLFVIAVFWSFMADLFNKEQGKRLFAFITGGRDRGQLTGSAITAFFAKVVGDVNPLLVSAAMLASTIVLMRYLLGWSVRQGRERRRHEEKPMGGNPFAGPAAGADLALPRRHRSLRLPDGRGQHLPVPPAGGPARHPLPGQQRTHDFPRPHRTHDERDHARPAAARRRPLDAASRRRGHDRGRAALRRRGLPADRRHRRRS